MFCWRKRKHVVFVLVAFLIVLVELAIKMLYGIDQDEQAIFCTMQRFINGELWLRDLYDPFQLAALLMTPFFWFCNAICPSNPVLLFRIIGIVAMFAVALLLYRESKHYINNDIVCILLSLCWLSITPKFIISFDHSHLFYTFLTLFLLEILRTINQRGSLIRIGLFFSLMVMCYPTMILLVIPLIIFVVYYGRVKGLLTFFLPCMLLVCFVIFPVLITEGINGLKHSIRMILADGTHSLSDSIFNKISNESKYYYKVLKFAGYYIAALVIETVFAKILLRYKPDIMMLGSKGHSEDAQPSV